MLFRLIARRTTLIACVPLERFQFHTSQQVTDIDLANKVIKTNKGKTFAYDILVIATGSDALYPPYMDAQRAAAIDGVFVYRNVADLDSCRRQRMLS